MLNWLVLNDEIHATAPVASKTRPSTLYLPDVVIHSFLFGVIDVRFTADCVANPAGFCSWGGLSISQRVAFSAEI